MPQLDFHNSNLQNNSFNPPPLRHGDNLTILTQLSDAYKLWHKYFVALPRHTKFTIGSKIDNLFTECLEAALTAEYTNRNKKLEIIQKLSMTFDALKFFLKLLWEMKALEDKKYIALSTALANTGKLLGGWIKLFANFQEKRPN